MAALQALEKTKVVALEVAQPVDRRPDAVTETPVPPLPKPTGGVPCARCERTLPKSAFSGAQLKKKEARKCSECIFAAIGAPAPASLESEATSDEVAPLPAARAQRPEQIVARREPSLDEQCARALTLQLMCEAEIDRLTDDIATGTLTERVASQRINALMMRRMHAAFAGKRVRIHGLARRQDLNGRCGRVQGATNSDERFCITLEAATAGGETMVSVGTQNLELVAEEPPAEVERSEYKESLVVDLDVSMPEFRGDFGELERRCTECGAAPADPAQLKRCGQCKLTRYCSRECQRAGWVRGGHRTSCGCQSAWPSKEAIAQGTAPQVLAALNEFGTACPQLAAACLLRLGPLNMGPEAVRRHWATTFGQLGVSAIERAYAAHASFPGVVMLATGACMLLGELVGVAALLRGSLVKLVVESLAREFPPPPSGWPANALVATNAVTLLKNLFMEQDYAQVERVKDQLIAAGGVPALCKALRAFPDHKFTQLHGMQVLFFTTANRYDAKEQAAANDAPRLCVQALRAYGAGTSDAAQKMCHDGVGALRNITVGEDEPGVARKAQSLRAGAARAIYDALATHVSDDEVPLICISALLNHFHRTTASQLQSTLPQGIDGVLKLVVRALRASKDNDELHMFGMSVMNTFTIHCERERLTRVAVSFGAVETMVSMMSRFPQHETILDGCCLTLDGWLEELCPLEFTRSGEDEFMRFFEAGVLEPCLRALRTFRGLSSAVELFRRIMRTYSTYSSSETFVEETSKGGHVKKQCTLHNTTSEAIDVARKVYELRSRLGDMYESVGMPRPVLKASGEGMQLPGYPTGGGCHDVNLELFVRLAARMPDTRQIVIIGNAFGLSTIALSFLFPRARVDAIDAEKEGAGNARGSKVTADIAQRHGLNVHVHAPFFSPWDVPRALAHLGPGSVDLAFIDGLHTDEQQYMDFTVLQPYMRANGNFAMVFDDVYMTMLWKSLELIRLLLPVGSGMRVHEYRPLNICNSFGTHVATTHADLGVKREFGAPAWAKPVGYHGTSMHSRMGA